MTKMSQGNKKITRKIPAMNNKILVRTSSFVLFQEIPATNWEILVGSGTGTRDSLYFFVFVFCFPDIKTKIQHFHFYYHC